MLILLLLEGNVEPEIENSSGIGRRICIKNYLMWNKKEGGERDHGRVTPKVALSSSGRFQQWDKFWWLFLTILGNK